MTLGRRGEQRDEFFTIELGLVLWVNEQRVAAGREDEGNLRMSPWYTVASDREE